MASYALELALAPPNLPLRIGPRRIGLINRRWVSSRVTLNVLLTPLAIIPLHRFGACLMPPDVFKARFLECNAFPLPQVQQGRVPAEGRVPES